MKTSSATRLVVGLLGVLMASQVWAVGVGVRAGTTGVGGDIGFEVAPTLSARIGYSAFNLDRDIRETDIDYSGKLKLSNLSALMDWSPLGPFRLTAGLVVATNKFSLTGRPTGGSYTFNGTTYTASQVGSVSAEVKGKRSVAPYLGVGYGNVAGAGFNFYSDVGVILQGGAKADVQATCGSALTPAQCSQLQSDVAAERARLGDSVNGFKAYPVLNVGLTIGF
jgi:hypothetical protein